MAKTTATVTVGADTKPFARAMRSLGTSISGKIGGVVTGGADRAAGMGMSMLGAGLGAGLGFLGLQGIGSAFNTLLAISPQLSAAFTQLKVAVAGALVPVAFQLAQSLNNLLPSITSGLAGFGQMLADAVDFWTQDAFDPAVWKDLGSAIYEQIREAISPSTIQSVMQTAGQVVEDVTGSSILGWLIENNPAAQVAGIAGSVAEFILPESGAKSI